MQMRKKRIFLFSIEMSIFILYSLDNNLAQSESHLHMQEILNFSASVVIHPGCTLQSHRELYLKKKKKDS